MRIGVWGLWLGVLWAQWVPGPRVDSLPPGWADSLLSRSAGDDTLFYQAEDSLAFDLYRREARLYRSVRLRQTTLRLETGYARLEWGTGLLYGYGRWENDSLRELPVFWYGQERYEMDSLRYDVAKRR
ncbi:MAG: hypothetical protein D6750_06635, partial [Bacteroidetes bacterium]